MKKLVLAMMMFAITGGVIAQGAKVTSAGNYYKSGDLRKAKVAIDGAATHPKTSTWPRTWMYMGKIYYAIATDTTAEYQDIQPGALDKSYAAFKKVLEKPDSKINMGELNMYLQVYVYNQMYNGAYKKYEVDDFSGAARGFVKCAEIRSLDKAKMDTSAIFNAAGMYAMADLTDSSIYYYNSILTTGYEEGITYSKLSKQYLIKGDTNMALQTTSAGRVAYPENQDLLIAEFNLYVGMGETEKAIANIDKAIEANPEKAAFYYVRGKLKETKGDRDEAIVDYRKTLEIDPDHLDANHDLGAIYINYGVKIAEERDALPFSDTKGYEAKQAELNTLYGEALPFIRKAYDLDPSDAEVQTILKQLYLRTKDMESYEKLQKEIDAAAAGQ
jgi:tetratricopeptide (TPR) repeat protein